MNKEAIDLLIQKNPQIKKSRGKLEQMKTGSYCIHRSWGMGVIREFDEKELKLIIDFDDDKKGHAMDPVFCIDKLDILPPENILVRQKENPGVIEELIKKSPADLIVEMLSHCPDQAATNTEIENLLRRLLGPTRYKKWWTQTKKLLVKDERVAVPPKKTDPYILRDEPVRAEDEILEEFFETKAPKKKIALAQKLIDLAVNHEDIKERLPEILKSLTASLQETRQLKPGERLHGIWIRNDLARGIHEDVEALQPTSQSILDASSDFSVLAEQIPSTHYKRLINLLERCYPDTWSKMVFDLLRNSSGKLTTECVNYLMEKGFADDIAATLKRWLSEQNIKAPVLYWIVKNRNSRKYGKLFKDLHGPRFLSSILFAIDYESLQNAGTRRIPLADLLGDDKDLIPELLAEANRETAHDLATSLMLNQGFEDLAKKSILARFIKLFPSVQSLVSGEAVKQEEQLIVSQASFDVRKKEYDILISEKIPENKEAIAVAREHGDLRENAEYKMARQDQETLLARKSQLELDLSRSQVTDFSDVTNDRVGIGSVVDLEQGSTGEIITYSILGAWDSNPDKNILSYLTPIGQAILNKTVGSTVQIEVDGHGEEWTIKDIARWVDVAKDQEAVV